MTTPTPAPAPMTARLRELEASAAELANKLADAAAHWRTKEFDDLCNANTGVIIEALRNTPTILRLLEAVEGAEKALEFIAAHKGKTLISTEHGEGYSHGANAGFEQLASAAKAALATLRAAREGAR